METNVLTKNPGKILAAETAFKRYGIKVNFIKKDYKEIQADTSLEIASFTAREAAKDLNIPIVREDHSLFINALGLPGPYINYIEKKLTAEVLINILENFQDKSGYFEVATVYALPSGDIKSWVFCVPIIFSMKPSGNLSSGWDRIIILKGQEKTLAEYPERERLGVWTKNYASIAKAIVNKEI